MDRREMLKGVLKGTAGGLMLAAAGNTVFAAEDAMHQHAGHQHSPASGKKNQGLIDAAADSVKKGQACLQHCIESLGQGDKELGKCAMAVNDMIAACVAIEQLANYNSPHLAKMARVAMDICRDCEDECRKFEKKHEVCKDSADSCAACFNECKKIAA
ncbi:MAG: four-helix bundle copper-binding protein [Betaproteobacteria bacterium]|nr:four-helix bundle copper-binding protein [Betaproteobacteria bacterium]